MDPSAYSDMARDQDFHWWYRGRRRILYEYIKRLDLGRDPKILEIGCGPGGNVPLLKEFGEVYLMEMDHFSCEFVKRKFGLDVREGHLPDNIPFKDTFFDLICMFDVLEHIKEDSEALRALKGHLNQGGMILLTVPAYQWLFGRHDEVLHHYRRYNIDKLGAILEKEGYEITFWSHFNTFLFPLIAFVRLIERWLGSGKPSAGTQNSCINFFLWKIFSAERFILKYIKFRFGVSIVIAARLRLQ